MGGPITSPLLQKIINKRLGIEPDKKGTTVWQALEDLHNLEDKYLSDYSELDPVFEAVDLVEADLKKRDEEAARNRQQS